MGYDFAFRSYVEEKAMIEPKGVASDLPDLDRLDDPRGGAAVWALLMVSAPVIAGVIIALIWVW